MPSFGRGAAAIALAALVLSAAPRAQSAQAADLFRQATVRETELRKEVEATPPTSPKAVDLLTRMRTLAHTYEDLWRLFPTSPYSDDALWHGAMLAADAFWQAGDAADRAASLKLFQALKTNFPTSSLVKRVQPEVARLESATAAEAPVVRPASVATSAAPSVAIPAVARPVTPAVSGYATLTAIRREVLPDVLRVTLELEREPVFNSERIDGPPRVFIDMQNTRASDGLKDALLPFADDVVRQIRVGRQLNGRIRVVLDLVGGGKYSVYALYNPFRIVVDFDRKQTGTQPAVRQAALTPAGRGSSAAPAVTGPAPAATGRGVTTLPGPPDQARGTATETPQARGVSAPTVSAPPATTSRTAAVPTLPAAHAEADKPRATIARGPEPGDAWPVPPPVTAAVPSPAASTRTPATAPPGATAPTSPSANSTGSYSLSRQLGLGIGRIVIDPGHGGHDPGAQVNGQVEAAITLDIALRLEKLFVKQGGVEVVLTRRTDTFVQLPERTAIANRAGADLFLSIHANANDDTSLRGVETYFLNLSPNPEAGRIAARENASSSKTMHDIEDIVKAIALNDKIDESRDFAAMVQNSLYEKLRPSNRNLRNLGVKQAPFVVLLGATMPSILAEISFLTNQQDAALLKSEKYRQQIAEALYQGVMRYQQSLKKAPAIARQDSASR